MNPKDKELYSPASGIAREYKIKSIYSKLNLLDKQQAFHYGYLGIALAIKNLMKRKVSRSGIIIGDMIFHDVRRKFKRSFQPITQILSSYNDIFIDDLYRKTKRKIKPVPKLDKKMRAIYYISLRKRLLELLKRRHQRTLAYLMKVPYYRVTTRIFICGNYYRSAKSVVNMAVRKLEQRYSLNSTYYPLFRNIKRFFSGFFMTWNGRYKKLPRVKSKKFKRGTLPIQTGSALIDFSSQKTRTPFGIANCVVNLHFTRRTIDDSIRFFKKLNYTALRFSRKFANLRIYNFEYALLLRDKEQEIKTENLGLRISQLWSKIQKKNKKLVRKTVQQQEVNRILAKKNAVEKKKKKIKKIFIHAIKRIELLKKIPKSVIYKFSKYIVSPNKKKIIKVILLQYAYNKRKNKLLKRRKQLLFKWLLKKINLSTAKRKRKILLKRIKVRLQNKIKPKPLTIRELNKQNQLLEQQKNKRKEFNRRSFIQRQDKRKRKKFKKGIRKTQKRFFLYKNILAPIELPSKPFIFINTHFKTRAKRRKIKFKFNLPRLFYGPIKRKNYDKLFLYTNSKMIYKNNSAKTSQQRLKMKFYKNKFKQTRANFIFALRKAKKNYKKQLFRRKKAPYEYKELEKIHYQAIRLIGLFKLNKLEKKKMLKNLPKEDFEEQKAVLTKYKKDKLTKFLNLFLKYNRNLNFFKLSRWKHYLNNKILKKPLKKINILFKLNLFLKSYPRKEDLDNTKIKKLIENLKKPYRLKTPKKNLKNKFKYKKFNPFINLQKFKYESKYKVLFLSDFINKPPKKINLTRSLFLNRKTAKRKKLEKKKINKYLARTKFKSANNRLKSNKHKNKFK